MPEVVETSVSGLRHALTELSYGEKSPAGVEPATLTFRGHFRVGQDVLSTRVLPEDTLTRTRSRDHDAWSTARERVLEIGRHPEGIEPSNSGMGGRGERSLAGERFVERTRWCGPALSQVAFASAFASRRHAQHPSALAADALVGRVDVRFPQEWPISATTVGSIECTSCHTTDLLWVRLVAVGQCGLGSAGSGLDGAAAGARRRSEVALTRHRRPWSGAETEPQRSGRQEKNDALTILSQAERRLYREVCSLFGACVRAGMLATGFEAVFATLLSSLRSHQGVLQPLFEQLTWRQLGRAVGVVLLGIEAHILDCRAISPDKNADPEWALLGRLALVPVQPHECALEFLHRAARRTHVDGDETAQPAMKEQERERTLVAFVDDAFVALDE